MKEENTKGLLGLFQKTGLFSKASAKSQSAAAEIEKEEKEITENTSADSRTSGDENIETEILPLSHFSVWEPFKDPLLVQIDEETLYCEYTQFAEKMSSLFNDRTNNFSEEENPQPKDALPHLCISRNRMAAWLYVLPPLNGGREITEAILITALEKERITIGILENVLKEISEGPIYGRPVLIARGVLARNGIDGSIKELYKRELEPEVKEDEKGNVDYRNLGLIQSVQEGGVICEITPAVSGENGKTVTGQPYPCTVKGSDPKVPAGRNTVLNEDRTLLLSQKSGHVTFVNERFQVDSVLKIDKDVDAATGNLDYDGDILIAGDVRNGFSVNATGSINIRGSVENARIHAGGHISISSGVLGNGQGTLTSGDYIRCGYLERCTVSAKGSVFADSIMNSKIESGKDIVVTSGKGMIVGGSLQAAGIIRSRIIGSRMTHLVTELIISNLSQSVDETDNLAKELRRVQKQKDEVRKNLLYLETSQRKGKENLLQKLQLAESSLDTREQEISDRIAEITAANAKTQEGSIRCYQLFPAARIRIGSASLSIQEEYSSIFIYKNKEGEIVIGNG